MTWTWIMLNSSYLCLNKYLLVRDWERTRASLVHMQLGVKLKTLCTQVVSSVANPWLEQILDSVNNQYTSHIVLFFLYHQFELLHTYLSQGLLLGLRISATPVTFLVQNKTWIDRNQSTVQLWLTVVLEIGPGASHVCISCALNTVSCLPRPLRCSFTLHIMCGRGCKTWVV